MCGVAKLGKDIARSSAAALQEEKLTDEVEVRLEPAERYSCSMGLGWLDIEICDCYLVLAG